MKECPSCLSPSTFIGDNLISFECFTNSVFRNGEWSTRQSWECVIKERDKLLAKVEELETINRKRIMREMRRQGPQMEGGE